MIYHTSTLVKPFEIDLLRNVTPSVQCLELLEQKGAMPRDVHGERRCSCEELRTMGCSESDTFHTLHNIGKMPPTVKRDVLKRLNCIYATGFWWCTVEA